MRRLSLLAVVAAAPPSSGCGAAALELLLAKAPEFRLVAEDVGGAVELAARGYDEDDTEDDLCSSDDGSSCRSDRYLGFAYYQCDEGAYGDFVQVGGPSGDRVTVVWDGDPDTAWRAGILREEDEEDARVEAVSTVALAPTD